MSLNFFRKIPVKIIFNKTDVILNKPLLLNKDSLSKYESYSIENFLYDVLGTETYAIIKEKMKIIIQGFELDLNLPLLFVYLNFAYMDNYLYITLYEKNK